MRIKGYASWDLVIGTWGCWGECMGVIWWDEGVRDSLGTKGEQWVYFGGKNCCETVRPGVGLGHYKLRILVVVSSGWSFIYVVPGQMTYPVLSLTLDSARSYVMYVVIVAIVGVVIVVTIIGVVVVIGVKGKQEKDKNQIKTGQKREACRSQEKFKAVAVNKEGKTKQNAKRMARNANAVKSYSSFKRKKKRKGLEVQMHQSIKSRANSAHC
nr:hypothetical protein [Tanacetum cinerariifolium]